MPVAVLSDLEDLDDVGVVNGGGDARLSAEALQEGGITREGGVQYLEGDGSVGSEYRKRGRRLLGRPPLSLQVPDICLFADAWIVPERKCPPIIPNAEAYNLNIRL